MKLIDPSGLDYIVALGSGQVIDDEHPVEYWEDIIRSNFPVGADERIIILDDISPESFGFMIRPPFFHLPRYDVRPRVQQIIEALNDFTLTDIKLIGFSEGAAAVATYLSNPSGINQHVRDNLTATFFLERPTWNALAGYDPYVNVPDVLREAKMGNVKIADIWNSDSPVHANPQAPDWDKRYRYPYSIRTWIGRIWAVLTCNAGYFVPTEQDHIDVMTAGNEHVRKVAEQLLGGD